MIKNGLVKARVCSYAHADVTASHLAGHTAVLPAARHHRLCLRSVRPPGNNTVNTAMPDSITKIPIVEYT